MREERICTLCKTNQVEDENHFLLKCDLYGPLRKKHKFDNCNDASGLFSEDNISALAEFVREAFKLREEVLENREETVVGRGG